MDLIEEGNEIILEVVKLLNEVSPEKCPGSAEFTNFVATRVADLTLDLTTIVTLAADIEAQLTNHEGTVH